MKINGGMNNVRRLFSEKYLNNKRSFQSLRRDDEK
jgi:hypothetical protein